MVEKYLRLTQNSIAKEDQIQQQLYSFDAGHSRTTMQDIPERSNQSSVYLLRRNDPLTTYVDIVLHQEPDDATLAHSVEDNLWLRHVTLRTKYAASRDWTHLLRALAQHPRLVTVEVADDDGTDQSTATARQLRPFWKLLLGHADSRICTLHLVGIKCLSNQCVVDLKKATSLRSLTLCRCSGTSRTTTATGTLPTRRADDDRVATGLATTLQQSTTIKELNLICLNESFLMPIFDSLITNQNTTIRALSVDVSDNFSETVARALQQVLVNTTSITRFHFSSSRQAHRTENMHSFRDMAEALIASTSVTEVIFSHNSWQDDAELCRILQHKTNLTLLGLYDCRIVSATCLDALIAHHLRCDTSPLRALEFRYAAAATTFSDGGIDHHLHRNNNYHAHGQGCFPEAGNAFERLLGLIAQSQHLQLLCVEGLNDVKIRALSRLLPDMPHLMHLELCVQPEFQHLRDEILETLQNNYTLQTIKCRVHVRHHTSLLAVTEPLFVDRRARWVERTAQRNERLAEWDHNPECVPRCLWAEALQLAMQAESESLFRTLLLEIVRQSLHDNSNDSAQYTTRVTNSRGKCFRSKQ